MYSFSPLTQGLVPSFRRTLCLLRYSIYTERGECSYTSISRLGSVPLGLPDLIIPPPKSSVCSCIADLRGKRMSPVPILVVGVELRSLFPGLPL